MNDVGLDKNCFGVFGNSIQDMRSHPMMELIREARNVLNSIHTNGIHGDVSKTDNSIALLGRVYADIQEQWRQTIIQASIEADTEEN